LWLSLAVVNTPGVSGLSFLLEDEKELVDLYPNPFGLDPQARIAELLPNPWKTARELAPTS
jgi:hypothetical protein